MSEHDEPRARGPTASDVARLAGVSQSAVSRSFTPGASISAAMRARVMRAAEALDYRPNLIARSLITRRSGMVGVAIGSLGNFLYPDMLERLAARLRDAGLRILLFTAPPDGDADPELAQIMRYQVDAVILAATTLSSALAEDCRRAGVPVILFNRTGRSRARGRSAN
jgi:DNA-binding LacI/PurR family transcriptional regulator